MCSKPAPRSSTVPPEYFIARSAVKNSGTNASMGRAPRSAVGPLCMSNMVSARQRQRGRQPQHQVSPRCLCEVSKPTTSSQLASSRQPPRQACSSTTAHSCSSTAAQLTHQLPPMAAPAAEPGSPSTGPDMPYHEAAASAAAAVAPSVGALAAVRRPALTPAGSPQPGAAAAWLGASSWCATWLSARPLAHS